MVIGDLVKVVRGSRQWMGRTAVVVGIDKGTSRRWITIILDGQKLMFDETEVMKVVNG